MVAAEGAAVRVGEADDRRPRRRPSVLGTVPTASPSASTATSRAHKAPPAPGAPAAEQRDHLSQLVELARVGRRQEGGQSRSEAAAQGEHGEPGEGCRDERACRNRERSTGGDPVPNPANQAVAGEDAERDRPVRDWAPANQASVRARWDSAEAACRTH